VRQDIFEGRIDLLVVGHFALTKRGNNAIEADLNGSSMRAENVQSAKHFAFRSTSASLSDLLTGSTTEPEAGFEPMSFVAVGRDMMGGI
jgi:hypothetical protein